MHKKYILRIIQSLSSFVIIFLISGCSSDFSGKTDNPNSQDAAIENIRQVLKDNPKLIEEVLWRDPDLIFDILSRDKIKLYEFAVKGGELKGKLKEWKRLKHEFENPFEPVYDVSRPFLGNPDAPLKIVVYSDFQCVNCVKMAKSVKEVLQENPDKITLYFKHYIRSKALPRQLAIYFEAIGEQSPELAWMFHDSVFKYRKEIAKNPNKVLQVIIAGLSLDPEKLSMDLKKKAIHERIESDTQEAARFKFKGTPILLINGVSLVGAQSKEKIEQIMKFIAMEGDLSLLKMTEEEKELCVECP